MKGTHKPDCACPVCRSGRGERLRMVQMNVQVPAEMLAAVQARAEKTGQSVGEVVREALAAHLPGKGTKKARK